jgi:RNA polymerase sigma-70 factor (ECF subfamily)
MVLLLVRHAPRVFSLATAALGRAAAEEIVQDVFVAVWRGADGFDPSRGAFRNWLLTITHNRIANELRRRGRRPDTRESLDTANNLDPADAGPGPDDNVWRDFRRETLREAVDSLPLKQRQALSLAFFDELTHEQVAAALEVPLGTAKTRIRSGIGALRQRLTPLRASLLIAVLLLCGLVWRGQQRVAQLDQDRRALWLVTTSDVVPVRLEPLPGVNPKTHGTYRGRPGEPLAVMTFSNFPPATAGSAYRAWARHGDRWTSLGNVELDAAGNGRLVAESPVLAGTPEGLQVDLESTGRQLPLTPTGKSIIAWPVKP